MSIVKYDNMKDIRNAFNRCYINVNNDTSEKKNIYTILNVYRSLLTEDEDLTLSADIESLIASRIKKKQDRKEFLERMVDMSRNCVLSTTGVNDQVFQVKEVHKTKTEFFVVKGVMRCDSSMCTDKCQQSCTHKYKICQLLKNLDINSSARYGGSELCLCTYMDVSNIKFKNGNISECRLEAKCNSVTYEGEIKSCKPNGYGTMICNGNYSSSYKYVGQFKDGLFHGDGEYTRDTIIYKGKFENGKFRGGNFTIKFVEKIKYTLDCRFDSMTSTFIFTYNNIEYDALSGPHINKYNKINNLTYRKKHNEVSYELFTNKSGHGITLFEDYVVLYNKKTNSFDDRIRWANNIITGAKTNFHCDTDPQEVDTERFMKKFSTDPSTFQIQIYNKCALLSIEGLTNKNSAVIKSFLKDHMTNDLANIVHDYIFGDENGQLSMVMYSPLGNLLNGTSYIENTGYGHWIIDPNKYIKKNECTTNTTLNNNNIQLDSSSGYNYPVVVDYSSLYPSLIRSWQR